MLTTLLLQQLKNCLRTRRRPIVANLGYGIGQNLKLAIHPLAIASNVVSNFEFLSFGSESLEHLAIG
jgi:hypothetical protein